MINQQKQHDSLAGDHAANDQGNVDWHKYHANSETLKHPSNRNRSKDHDQKTV